MNFINYFMKKMRWVRKFLASYAPVAILFGLFTVTAAILQGIDRHKWIVFNSLLGLIVQIGA